MKPVKISQLIMSLMFGFGCYTFCKIGLESIAIGVVSVHVMMIGFLLGNNIEK